MRACLCEAGRPRTRSGNNSDKRSHHMYRPDTGEPAVWRQDAHRRRVPRAGGIGQKALLHARRRKGIRRVKGKPNARKHCLLTRDAIEERREIRALLGEVRKCAVTATPTMTWCILGCPRGTRCRLHRLPISNVVRISGNVRFLLSDRTVLLKAAACTGLRRNFQTCRARVSSRNAWIANACGADLGIFSGHKSAADTQLPR